MAGMNLIKNLKTLISSRVSLETVPTNGILNFDNKNHDKNDDDNSDDKNNINNNNQNIFWQ